MRKSTLLRLTALLSGGVLLQFAGCAAALAPTVASYLESVLLQSILTLLLPV